MVLSRGDIALINLNPQKGDEVGKIRPCLILSGNDENNILDTVIILPLSTKLLDNTEPFRFRILKRDKLLQDSDVLVNQIRTISKKRIIKIIAQITRQEYINIIDNLCKNFTTD